jgi:hypothetical protein
MHRRGSGNASDYGPHDRSRPRRARARRLRRRRRGDDALTTRTEAESVTLEEDRAYQLAFDFCESAPLDTVSLFGGDPEDLARSFSEEIRPSLREAALAGCLAALEGGE